MDTEPYTSSEPFTSTTDPYRPIPGLLVLHIRRGDFEQHCEHLARWASEFNGFNSFDGLPDQLTAIPGGGGGGETTEENLAFYFTRCYPSIEQITQKVEAVRQTPEGKGLKDVYVMTNAKKEWAEELKGALRKMGDWQRVSTSRDLVLTKEEKYVAQAVDMLIGQRAQVLIGNGVSCLRFIMPAGRAEFHSSPASHQTSSCSAWLVTYRQGVIASGRLDTIYCRTVYHRTRTFTMIGSHDCHCTNVHL